MDGFLWAATWLHEASGDLSYYYMNYVIDNVASLGGTNDKILNLVGMSSMWEFSSKTQNPSCKEEVGRVMLFYRNIRKKT